MNTDMSNREIEAPGTPDGNYASACFALWQVNKEGFRDNPAVFDDICKELLPI